MSSTLTFNLAPTSTSQVLNYLNYLKVKLCSRTYEFFTLGKVSHLLDSNRRLLHPPARGLPVRIPYSPHIYRNSPGEINDCSD